MCAGREVASIAETVWRWDAAFPEAAVVVILLHVKYSIPYHSVRSLAAMLPFM